MHNRQKRIACVLALCLMTSACAVPVHANLAAGIWAGSVLGTIFHTNYTGGRSPGIHRKNQQKYKDAMHVLENMNWVGVAKSSGGDMYFDQDTLKETKEADGRHVYATVKDTFTQEGAKALAESSKGRLNASEVSYSLYVVDFGEKGCRIAGPVYYYDKDGKELLHVNASRAFLDIQSRNFGITLPKAYTEGSVEAIMKEKVFSYDDRLKEEEQQQE